MSSAFSVSQPSQVHLRFLGAEGNGIQSGPRRITFTEGSIARAPPSFADWEPGRTVRFATLPTDCDLDVFAMAIG